MGVSRLLILSQGGAGVKVRLELDHEGNHKRCEKRDFRFCSNFWWKSRFGWSVEIEIGEKF